MNCGGRIYKGEDVSVSIPFNISGYTDLEVSYYTDSEVHIERYEEQLVVEDGFIIAEFDNTDLDLLPDGVLRYTITFKVDGVDYVSSNNTPYYLKTPKDYDAKTAEEVYEDGYESGFTVGHTSGYTDGYAEGEIVGKAAGYVSGYTAGEAVGYESGFTDGYSSGNTDGYDVGWRDGYRSGASSSSGAAYQAGYSHGWQDGVSDGKGMIARDAISLSFSANGEWHKDFLDDIYANSVVVNIDTEPIWADAFLDGMFTSAHTFPANTGTIYPKEHNWKATHLNLWASGTAEVTAAYTTEFIDEITGDAPNSFAYIRGGSYSDWTRFGSNMSISEGTYEFKYLVAYHDNEWRCNRLFPDAECGFIVKLSTSTWEVISSAGTITSRTFYYEEY